MINIMKTKLILSKDGSFVYGLATPFLDRIKSGLGKASIKRASTIEYDNTMGKWCCDIIKFKEIDWFDTREQAVEWETKFLNDRLEEVV